MPNLLFWNIKATHSSSFLWRHTKFKKKLQFVKIWRYFSENVCSVYLYIHWQGMRPTPFNFIEIKSGAEWFYLDPHVTRCCFLHLIFWATSARPFFHGMYNRMVNKFHVIFPKKVLVGIPLATHFCDVVEYPDSYSKFYLHFFSKNDHKSAQICAPWVERLPIMFENVFEVIFDHTIHARNLGDFPKAKKKNNITKVRCQVYDLHFKIFSNAYNLSKFLNS